MSSLFPITKEKHQIRKMIMEASEYCTSLLSLPGDDITIESYCVKKNMYVRGIEMSSNLHIINKEKMKKIGIDYVNIQFQKVEDLDRFDIAFIDLFGNLTKSIVDKLQEFSVGCTVGITLNLKVRNNPWFENILKELGLPKNYDSVRILNTILLEEIGFEITESITYNNGRTKMSFLMMRKTK